MKPLASSILCSYSRNGNQLPTNTSATQRWSYHRVENECVSGPVPGDIYKTDKHAIFTCRHPTKTMHCNLPKPIILTHAMLKGCCMESIDLIVSKITSPFESYRSNWIYVHLTNFTFSSSNI